MIGPHHLTSLPQGATNSMPEFQRCVTHVLAEEVLEYGDGFVDDVTVYGPSSRYDDEEVAPEIRRFVYEYVNTLTHFLIRFKAAGITASGRKLILATPMLEVIGSVVSADSWHLAQGLVSKIVKWPIPTTVSNVRAFLGTAGAGQKWIRGFSIIARPLTLLTRVTVVTFKFEEEEMEAFKMLKELIMAAPILIRIDYASVKIIQPLPRESDDGHVIVAIDSCKLGAGWTLSQRQNGEIKLAIFGGCTYNETESRYSQPKAELYGVFRVIKPLRHWLWELHF
jgi:hypothetical protein